MGKKRAQNVVSDEEEEDLTNDPGAPTSINPYEVLGLSQEASSDEIKIAYRRAALKNHPDKVSPDDKEAAHTKFQEIAFAYAILSDERRRARYDRTGRTEESLEDDDDFDWADFYRAQLHEIPLAEEIEKVKKEYKGSEEERDAVIDAFRKANGKMSLVYELVMVSDWEEDDERFRDIINTAVETGDLPGFSKLKPMTEKQKAQLRKKKEAEAAEAREVAREMGVEDELFGDRSTNGQSSKNGKSGTSKKKGSAVKGEDALAAIIRQRQESRQEGFFDRLEAKYASNGKGGKREPDEPPEEAFARNRKRGKVGGDEGQGSAKGKKRRS